MINVSNVLNSCLGTFSELLFFVLSPTPWHKMINHRHRTHIYSNVFNFFPHKDKIIFFTWNLPPASTCGKFFFDKNFDTCRLSVTFWQNIFSIRSPVYKIVNSSQVHGSWTWALWPCTVVNIICYFCKLYKECDNFSMLVQSINWPLIERYESLGHKILTFCWVIPAQNTSLKLKCLKISNLDT